ncbi:helix-turn-helix transcriptional regulator [Streptomyces sp. NPDC047985]|uniref:helix-turn-helix domain-containing protein n=1 Tax=Streptomyces sp. NPDC047985 TaxID=3155384 RepID=UPI0034276205
MTFKPQPLTPYLSARHYFGSEQRRHRERANMSLVQLADTLNSSKSTLARIETAELMPPPDIPARLDAAFGTDRHFHGLYELAKKEIHPDQYRRYMDFEAKAEVIEVYEPQVVPGLLQTREYAYELLRCQEDLNAEQVEQLVNARMSRRDWPADAAPLRWAILDEAVLRRPVGTPEGMLKQLVSLLEHVDTPNCKVQVLPFSAGPHALMGGTLNLLTLPDDTTVAYEESISTGYLHEDRETVLKRRRQYEVLRANALSLAESAELIRKAMEDYKPCDTPPS